MNSVTISPLSKYISNEIKLPLSKSISNRALIISALSRGSIDPGDLSEADDTSLLAELLFQSIEGKVRVLNAGNAGTVFRFLTAYLAIQEGEYTLKADDRMKKRPIAPLVNALRQIGANITYLGGPASPPLQITGKKLKGTDNDNVSGGS